MGGGSWRADAGVEASASGGSEEPAETWRRAGRVTTWELSNFCEHCVTLFYPLPTLLSFSSISLCFIHHKVIWPFWPFPYGMQQLSANYVLKPNVAAKPHCSRYCFEQTGIGSYRLYLLVPIQANSLSN